MSSHENGLPGQESYEKAATALRDASQIPANSDETNPAADRTIAEAQAHATLAIWEALADIAQELHLIRRQREGYWAPPLLVLAA